MAKRSKRVKARITARVQPPGKAFDIKAVEIETTIVDKVVPNILVDGGSGLNIIPAQIIKKLGLSLTGPSSFVINMANQSPVMPLGQIKDCKIIIGGEEYMITFHAIRRHTSKDSFLMLLRRPWLRMANAVVDWGGVKPSITYGPKENKVKVSIGSIVSVDAKGELFLDGDRKMKAIKRRMGS